MAFNHLRRNSDYRIFISYRRVGGIDTARWLFDQLTARGYDVFMDLEGLRSGIFNQSLYQEIASRNVFLLILSEGALDRCHHEGDWVRNEIAHALRCGKRIIPIFLKNAQFPDDLPEDIAPIRSYHGLPVSYDFFDAFMERLESFIRGDSESSPSPVKRKYLAAGAAMAALLLGAFLLGKLSHGPTPDDSLASSMGTTAQTEAPTQAQETSAPTKESTEEPTESSTESTLPVPTDVEPMNNSVVNLCNGGFVFDDCNNHSTWLGNPDIRWFNYLYHLESPTLFYYYNSSRIIQTHWYNGDAVLYNELLTNVDCRYLGVAENWLYFVLVEDGIANLYRAANNLENHTIGEPECIVKDIIAKNQLTISNGYIYYWKRNEGIYRCHYDGTNTQLLWSNGGESSYDGFVTFQVTDHYLYFWSPNSGIYTVPVTGGSVCHLVNTEKETAKISHAIMQEGSLFFIMEYDDSSSPAELWVAATDGANVKCFAVLEDITTRILMFNTGAYSTLYICAESKQGMYLYSYYTPNHTLTLVDEITY